MCVSRGSGPAIVPPSPPPPPAPPAPSAPDFKPLEPAKDETPRDRRKKSGRNSLRIDRTTSVPGYGSGLNIPV